jgi:hypothetical protein
VWVKTTQSKFEQYGITITTQRQLQDNDYIMHMELQDNPEFFMACRFDADVKILTNDEMEALLALEPINE